MRGHAEIARLAAEARKRFAAYEEATAERDEAIKRHAADMTLGAIAEAAGISVGRVSHIVGYRGVKVGRPRKNIPPRS